MQSVVSVGGFVCRDEGVFERAGKRAVRATEAAGAEYASTVQSAWVGVGASGGYVVWRTRFSMARLRGRAAGPCCFTCGGQGR